MDRTLDRAPGLSARLKLTLSYAGFLMLAGALMLVMVWFFLLRYVPDDNAVQAPDGIQPGQAFLVRASGQVLGMALLFQLVFGLLGGWYLAGRVLAPLSKIT